MKLNWMLVALLSFLIFSYKQLQDSGKYNIDSVVSDQGTEIFEDNWESIKQYYQFPEWFQDAKLGIFIHWGNYSVPAFGTEW